MNLKYYGSKIVQQAEVLEMTPLYLPCKRKQPAKLLNENEAPLCDENGAPLCDENGAPLCDEVSHVTTFYTRI